MHTFYSLIKVYNLFIIICFVLSHHSFTSKSTGNKTQKHSFYRMNDKFTKLFNTIEVSNNHSNNNLNRTLNSKSKSETETKESLTKEDSEPNIYNKISGTKFKAIINGNKLNTNISDKCDCKCNCSCGLHHTHEESLHLYTFDEEDDPDMDVDDIEELEQIQKPYKYIPMETIELAHQRQPNRASTTSTTTISPPFKSVITNFASSVESVVQIGISLMLTVLVGTLFGKLSLVKFMSRDSKLSTDKNKQIITKSGYYNKFYTRLDDYNDGRNYNYPLLLIEEWLQKYDD